MSKDDLMYYTLVIAGVFMIVLSAYASEGDCLAIRNYDKRQECLAYQRGDPADCTSIRDYDQRQLCRARADNQSRFKKLLGR